MVNTIEIGDGRYGKYRAYYGDDGLYLSFEGLVNNVIVGNYQTDGLWQQDIMGIWHKSFSMELHIKTSASDTTHDNVYHTVYGFNSTFISEGAGNARRKTYNGEKNIMESCMSYTQQSGGSLYSRPGKTARSEKSSKLICLMQSVMIPRSSVSIRLE